MKLGVLAITVVATVAVYAERFITFAGTIPSLGGFIAGVARNDSQASDAVSVDATGFVEVRAGGVFAKGDLLMSDTNGRAIKYIPTETKSAVLIGGAAGNHAVAGLAAGSTLVSVIQIFTTQAKGVTNIVDLTSEFTAGRGKINNAGKTGTGGHQLLVTWQTPNNHAVAVATQAASQSGDLITIKLIS